MVLRILMRYLANNEQLIQKLSETYPIRRAAQLTAYLWTKGKWTTQESLEKIIQFQNIKNIGEQLKDASKKLQSASVTFSKDAQELMKEGQELMKAGMKEIQGKIKQK